MKYSKNLVMVLIVGSIFLNNGSMTYAEKKDIDVQNGKVCTGNKVAITISPSLSNLRKVMELNEENTVSIEIQNLSSCSQKVKLTTSKQISTENPIISLDVNEKRNIDFVVHSNKTGFNEEYVYFQTVTTGIEQRVILKSNISFNVTE